MLTPSQHVLAHPIEPSLQINQQTIDLQPNTAYYQHTAQPSPRQTLQLLTNAVSSCGLVTFPTPLTPALPPKLGLIPSSSELPNPRPTLPLPLGVPSLGDGAECLMEDEGARAGDEFENVSRSCWTEGEGAVIVGESGGSEGEAGGAIGVQVATRYEVCSG